MTIILQNWILNYNILVPTHNKIGKMYESIGIKREEVKILGLLLSNGQLLRCSRVLGKNSIMCFCFKYNNVTNSDSPSYKLEGNRCYRSIQP